MARKAIKREKASVEVILDDQMPEILVPSESSAQAIASPEIEMRDVQQLHDSLSGQVNVSIGMLYSLAYVSCVIYLPLIDPPSQHC